MISNSSHAKMNDKNATKNLCCHIWKFVVFVSLEPVPSCIQLLPKRLVLIEIAAGHGYGFLALEWLDSKKCLVSVHPRPSLKIHFSVVLAPNSQVW